MINKIPFNAPSIVGEELKNIEEVLELKHLSGDGSFTKRCNKQIEELTAAGKALLTHSCTAALEMAAILADLKVGDEVIMPSFTFVSTANAFVLRGAIPVFVDIDPDTLNIDPRAVNAAITDRTRAIVAVHYAGVSAPMDELSEIARTHALLLIEDAAQALGASYKGRPCGGIADLGAISFHETKNVISGEGGALTINREDLKARAEIIREKGTNRSQFIRGEVDKYTWVDIGSSYLPSEIVAAFLAAQLDKIHEINAQRVAVFNQYYDAFSTLEARERIRRPIVPRHCKHNGHIFYLLTRDAEDRDAFMLHMRALGISSPFHYVPLHSSPAGKRFSRSEGDMNVTNNVYDRLVRLPVHLALGNQTGRIIDAAVDFFRN